MDSQKGATTKILIVEDDIIIASLIEHFLKPKGYTIVGKASFGEEAIILSAQHHPDLILMDIGLAGKMDGITAADFILNLFSIPFIFISGQDDDDTLTRSIEAHPNSFIIKPFTAKDLYTNIGIAFRNDLIKKKNKSFRYNILGEVIKISLNQPSSFFVVDKNLRIIFLNPYAERYIRAKRADVIMDPLLSHLNFKIEGKKTPTHVFNDILRGTAIVGSKQFAEGKLPDGKNSRIMIQRADIIDEEKMIIGEIIRII
jgi:CheY-like chemotaxis protein